LIFKRVKERVVMEKSNNKVRASIFYVLVYMIIASITALVAISLKLI